MEREGVLRPQLVRGVLWMLEMSLGAGVGAIACSCWLLTCVSEGKLLFIMKCLLHNNLLLIMSSNSC